MNRPKVCWQDPISTPPTDLYVGKAILCPTFGGSSLGLVSDLSKNRASC
jgi:hypothetical protein